MAIIRKISEPLTDDWRKSPVMIKLMDRDKKRDQKAWARHQQKIKEKKRIMKEDHYRHLLGDIVLTVIVACFCAVMLCATILFIKWGLLRTKSETSIPFEGESF